MDIPYTHTIVCDPDTGNVIATLSAPVGMSDAILAMNYPKQGPKKHIHIQVDQTTREKCAREQHQGYKHDGKGGLMKDGHPLPPFTPPKGNQP